MKDRDFDIKYTNSSKPGGQNVNKVETCVVITHVPTGLQERCQDSRSKKQNLKIAKERLDKKIQKQKDNQIQEAKNEKRKELIKNQSVIRTYNYNKNEVRDHRTKIKYDLKKFMKGEIDL